MMLAEWLAWKDHTPQWLAVNCGFSISQARLWAEDGAIPRKKEDRDKIFDITKGHVSYDIDLFKDHPDTIQKKTSRHRYVKGES